MAQVENDRNDHRVSMPLLCAGLPTIRPGCPEQQVPDILLMVSLDNCVFLYLVLQLTLEFREKKPCIQNHFMIRIRINVFS